MRRGRDRDREGGDHRDQERDGAADSPCHVLMMEQRVTATDVVLGAFAS